MLAGPLLEINALWESIESTQTYLAIPTSIKKVKIYILEMNHVKPRVNLTVPA
jgi:hypothetical protein